MKKGYALFCSMILSIGILVTPATAQAEPNQAMTAESKQIIQTVQTAEKEDYQDQRVIVTLKDTTPAYIEENYPLAQAEMIKTDTYLFKIKKSAGTLETLIKQLLADRTHISIAEPNYKATISSSSTDKKLWAKNNSSYPEFDINYNKIDPAQSKKKIKIAVVDTGIDYNHPALKNVISKTKSGAVNGRDFGDNDNDPMDKDSHGTHVAGTIAGANGIGLDTNVEIMPLKVERSDGNIYVSDIIAAMDYAVKNKAAIVNLSLITPFKSQEMKKTIDKAKNVLFIAAAGNNGGNNDKEAGGTNVNLMTPLYPASFDSPNIISVANLKQNGFLEESSNYGKTSVDLAAPGTNIYSTLPNGKYGYKTGTSMAAPQVTGIAALLEGKYTSDSAVQIKSRILKNVHKLSALNGKMTTGGLLDAYKAFSPDTLTSDRYYYIRSVGSGLYMNVKGNSSKENTALWQSGMNGKAGEQWKIVKNSNGSVYLQSRLGKVLQLKNNSKNPNTVLQINKKNTKNNAQQFYLSKIANGRYSIESWKKQTNVAGVSGNTKASKSAILAKRNQESLSEQWEFKPVAIQSGKTYNLISKKSGKALEISSTSKLAGAKLYQNTSKNSISQQFILKKDSKGIQIVSKANPKYALEIAGNKMAKRTKLSMQTQKNTKGQHFTFKFQSDGSVTIAALSSTKYGLDVKGASTKNKTAIQLYSLKNLDNQKWFLIPR